MTDRLLGFGIYWGVWLFIPMLIDGAITLAHLLGVVVARLRHPSIRSLPEPAYWPSVSVVIPVHNGEATLGACIRSLRAQRYPHELLEIIVVDNRSTDATLRVARAEQAEPFAGSLQVMSTPTAGKSWALNAGFHGARGSYVCNIDADMVLHPDALRNAVRILDARPEVAALTAAVEVLPPAEHEPPLYKAIAECEFLEYYASFRIGRQFQSLTGSLFTLAGAFSMFRADVLLQTYLYSQQSVSEDTDLTFQLYEREGGARLVCSPDVVAYTEPTGSLEKFYSQRVRWQRGELEVLALHPKTLRRGLHPLRLAPARTLLVDHTLAFPRVVWTFLLPMLVVFGYPLELVTTASVAMYLSYSLIEGSSQLVSYLLADGAARERIRRNWWVFLAMPAYRFVLFWFRFGGFVTVLNESQSWRTRSPWQETKAALRGGRGAAGLRRRRPAPRDDPAAPAGSPHPASAATDSLPSGSPTPLAEQERELAPAARDR